VSVVPKCMAYLCGVFVFKGKVRNIELATSFLGTAWGKSSGCLCPSLVYSLQLPACFILLFSHVMTKCNIDVNCLSRSNFLGCGILHYISRLWFCNEGRVGHFWSTMAMTTYVEASYVRSYYLVRPIHHHPSAPPLHAFWWEWDSPKFWYRPT